MAYNHFLFMSNSNELEKWRKFELIGIHACTPMAVTQCQWQLALYLRVICCRFVLATVVHCKIHTVPFGVLSCVFWRVYALFVRPTHHDPCTYTRRLYGSRIFIAMMRDMWEQQQMPFQSLSQLFWPTHGHAQTFLSLSVSCTSKGQRSALLFFNRIEKQRK